MLRIALTTCLLLPTLAAQTAAPASEATVLEVATFGPAGWRQRLGPTNLGSLLESEAGRALWTPQVTQIDGFWRQLLGVEGAEFRQARQRVLDYGGAVQIRVWARPGDPGRPTMAAGMVLENDARTDMAALARDLAVLIPRVAERDWQNTKVGDRELAVIENYGHLLTAPVVEDGHLLLCAAPTDDLPATLARLRAIARPAAVRPDAPALSMRLDIAHMMTLLANEGEAAWLQVLGFSALAAAELHVGGAGPHVLIEPRLQFRDGDRGLLAALFPATQRLSAFLSLPAPTGTFKAGHFDLRALYEAGERLASSFADEPLAELRKKAVDEFGLDPVTDLLAHTATDVLLLGRLEDILERGPAMLLAFRLHDEAKFKAGLQTVVAKGKGVLNKKDTQEHDGIEIWQYGDMFTGDTWVAVGREMVVIGRGENATEAIAGLLDQVKKEPLCPPEGKPGDPWTDLARHAPAGLNGAATSDIVPVLQALSLFSEGLEEMLPIPDISFERLRDPEALEAAAAMLRQHHLDRMRTLTGHDGTTWRWRVFW